MQASDPLFQFLLSIIQYNLICMAICHMVQANFCQLLLASCGKRCSQGEMLDFQRYLYRM